MVTAEAGVYYLEDTTDPFGVGAGVFVLRGVPAAHPIRAYGTSNCQVGIHRGASACMLAMLLMLPSSRVVCPCVCPCQVGMSGGTPVLGGVWAYGDVTITIPHACAPGARISLDCSYHGPMGGTHRLRHQPACAPPAGGTTPSPGSSPPSTPPAPAASSSPPAAARPPPPPPSVRRPAAGTPAVVSAQNADAASGLVGASRRRTQRDAQTPRVHS